MRNLVYILLFTLAWQSCVSGSKYSEAASHIERLKADSALFAKRNRMLTEEKEQLENKSATMEQTLNQRLQEKEDSLNMKESLLRQRELSINDMKARKNEEREAFETLSKSVFELFNDYSVNDVHRSTNCTQMIVEISDRLLFMPSSSKLDNAKAQVIFVKIAQAVAKNPDLNIVVVGHTDSLTYVKEKVEDNWTAGNVKANNIVKVLTKEYKLSPYKISSSSRAETVPLSKINVGLGRGRIEFVFYSAFLPCIHSKE